MAVSPHSVPVRASEWLIALQEQPQDQRLRARFAAWLAESPDHAADWAEIDRVQALMGQLDMQAYRADRQTPVRRWVSMMAGVAVAACLLLLFGPGLMVWIRADYRTGTGEQKLVRLLDGSVIRLAPESAIAVHGAGRQVALLKGEAFFTVRHDAARPFQVVAQDMRVTDIGTQFDVRLRANGVGVGVREGLVAVQATRLAARAIHPGEMLRIGADGHTDHAIVPSQEIGAWAQGQLIVKRQPVGEVVDALRPYFHGVILLRGERLAAQPLTGVLDLTDPAKALRAVAEGQGAQVYRISPWLLIISGT